MENIVKTLIMQGTNNAGWADPKCPIWQWVFTSLGFQKNVQVLANWRNRQTDEEVGKLLSYLTGEASTREKVQRFLNQDEEAETSTRTCGTDCLLLTIISWYSNYLEADLRDPNTPVSSQLLSAVTTVRMLVTDGVKTNNPVVVTSILTPEGVGSRDARRILLQQSKRYSRLVKSGA